MISPIYELVQKHGVPAALRIREEQMKVWSLRRGRHQHHHLPMWIAQGRHALLRESTAQPWVGEHYPYRDDYFWMDFVH